MISLKRYVANSSSNGPGQSIDFRPKLPSFAQFSKWRLEAGCNILSFSVNQLFARHGFRSINTLKMSPSSSKLERQFDLDSSFSSCPETKLCKSISHYTRSAISFPRVSHGTNHNTWYPFVSITEKLGKKRTRLNFWRQKRNWNLFI